MRISFQNANKNIEGRKMGRKLSFKQGLIGLAGWKDSYNVLFF
jgi:hypothetical protein